MQVNKYINRERIIIQIPAHPESFSFIAEIIQQIDDFSMSFVSNKTTVPIKDTGIKKFEIDAEDTPQEALNTDTVSNATVQKGSQVKQVREYMLSSNSFTVKDLKLHFPNLTATTINNALYLAKSKGLITAISRGKYVVNKT